MTIEEEITNNKRQKTETATTATPVRVLALSSKAGCGKDYLSENFIVRWFIRRGKHVRVVALADELKKLCNDKEGVTFERMFIDKDTESRKLLQNVGVAERDSKGADIWIKKLDFQIQIDLFRKCDVVIVTDLRFANELQYFQDRGDARCIRIHAPQRNADKIRRETNGNAEATAAIMSHVSECELDTAEFDFCLNNDYCNEATSQHDLIQYLEQLPF